MLVRFAVVTVVVVMDVGVIMVVVVVFAGVDSVKNILIAVVK